MGLGTTSLSAFVAAAAFVACAAAQTVLLIPDSVTDTVGMYSPADGTYLGDLIVDADPGPAGNLETPINAIVGSDGRVYVSDQIKDAVVRYDQTGAFIDVFCGPAAGLDNVRGIAFDGDELLVSYASVTKPVVRGVARFSAAGVRLPDFIADGIDPFDVFLLGGDVLASDIDTNTVFRYDTAGNQIAPLFSVDFPEQIAFRPSNGHFLNIAHNGNRITEFDLAGSLFATIAITSLGRGIAELDNGSFLMTNTNGIREIDPASGTTVRLIRSGSGFRFIERVLLGNLPCPVPGCDAADLNGDCLVDLTDLTLLLSAFGDVGEPGSVVGDTNQDGLVDLVDLTTLLSAFGLNCAP